MRAPRALARLAALLLLSSAMELLWLAGALPAWAVGGAEPWRARIFRAWSRGALRLLAVRVQVVGSAPRAPFLLVSNHLGYLDIVVFARETGARFVSKSEVAAWPVVGWLARSMGTVFVDRRRHRDLVRAAGAMAAARAEGGGVVLFPEGTSTPGNEVAPFRASLLAPAARGGWDVHHASIRYTTAPGDPPASRAVAWWGDMSFLPHVWKLLSLRGVQARIVFGAEPVRDPHRKSLARHLHRAVAEHFEPLRRGSSPGGEPGEHGDLW